MYDKIMKLARQRGESIPKIEKACGFGKGTITKWNTSTPKADNLKKVADYFGVSIEYFLEG